MRLPVLTFDDVARTQLCCGCGVCAAEHPDRYRMQDAPAFGRRPRNISQNHQATNGAPARTTPDPTLHLCPGARLQHDFDERDPELDRDLRHAWGPVRTVWEGFAADDDIRFAGSSGGAASALALYCIERAGMHGVLHTAAQRDKPYLNTTVLSTTRQQLLDHTGSRYAPASPCDGLQRIEDAPAPCVFIGKPCDAAGARNLAKHRPALDAKLGLNIAFFCAGVPSTDGNLALLKKAGVHDPDAVRSLRYRGNGWPGLWTVRWTDANGDEHEHHYTYEESWDFLQRYRQWRCYICPDHTGEFADVAVGDPWYRPIQPGEPGKSLIVARTKRGVDIVNAAARAGYLTLETQDNSLLPRSQPNLLSTRGRLFGQQLALRLAGAPTPTYRGFFLARAWRRLSAKDKARSILATLKRIPRKRLRQPVDVFAERHTTGAAS